MVYRQIDVKEFGATGDGSTDDTAAIQAAMDACQAESDDLGLQGLPVPVIFPPGRYQVSDTIDLPYLASVTQSDVNPKWHLSGYGAKIETSVDKPIFECAPPDVQSVNFWTYDIEGFCFVGDHTWSVESGFTTRTDQWGIKILNTYLSTIKSCSFQRLYGGFLGSTLALNTHVEFCKAVSVSFPYKSEGQNTTYYGCRADMTDPEGVVYQSAGPVRVVECLAEGTRCKHVVESGGGDVQVDHIHFEMNEGCLYAFRLPMNRDQRALITNPIVSGNGDYGLFDATDSQFESGIEFNGVDKNGPSDHPTYSGATTYSIGQRVNYSGNTYQSLVSSNLGNQPDISATEWKDEGTDAWFRGPRTNVFYVMKRALSSVTADWRPQNSWMNASKWDNSLPRFIEYEGYDALSPHVGTWRAGHTSAIVPIADGDATPDVTFGDYCLTANTSSTTITDFDTGHAESHVRGLYPVVLEINDAFTTLQHTDGQFELIGGADIVCESGDYFVFRKDSAQVWRQISGSRKPNPKLASVTASDATPSVTGVEKLTATAGASTWSITDFDGTLVDGQVLTVLIDNTGAGAITITDGSGINLDNGTNFTPSSKASLSLVYDGTDWNETGRAQY